MYVIWFCYLYENFRSIQKPIIAIEELTMEFKDPDVIDVPDQRGATLVSLYAGAKDPIELAERKRQLELLKPNYLKGIGLLDNWNERGR